MAYNQNGSQYPYYNNGRQQHPNQPPPVPPHPPLPPNPPPHSSLAERQNAELFIAASHPQSRHPLPQLITPHSPMVPTHATYNPGDYQSMPISPTSYVQPTNWPTSPIVPSTPSSYNPADYAPQTPSYNSPYQQQVQFQSQSPQSQLPQQLPPQFSQQLPQPSNSNRQRPSVNTTFSSSYGYTAPPPLPAIPSANESPSQDWSQLPGSGVTRYSSMRYGNHVSPQNPNASPGQHSQHSQHSRNSSSVSYTSNQQSPAPPLPPPHNYRVNNYDLTYRPLPSAPISNIAHNDVFNDNKLVETEDEHLASGKASTHHTNGHTYDDNSIASPTGTAKPPYPEDSDGDIAVDLSAMGGGWDAHMSYGGAANDLTLNRTDSMRTFHDRNRSQTISSSESMRMSGNVSESDNNYGLYSATGGLADPSLGNRRLSFDEGDEMALTGEHAAAGYEFFHPGILNRPLPPQPPPHDHLRSSHSTSTISSARRSDLSMDRMSSFSSRTALVAPNRHASLINPPVAPMTLPPVRAITDADERKRYKRASANNYEKAEDRTTPLGGPMDNLPAVSAKKLNPSKLTAYDLDRCTQPWSMRALAIWLKDLAQDVEQNEKTLQDALLVLFTDKIRALNIAEAELLASQVISSFLSAGVLYREEEWLAFRHAETSGVIIQLTGSGCFAPRAHDFESSYKCYSNRCLRSERKILLSNEEDENLGEDWATYWKLTTEDTSAHNKKEIERQHNLHELVQKEEGYIKDLTVLQVVFRDGLKTAKVLNSKDLARFSADVFGKIDPVKKSNEDYLVPQMKYRQKEQGPWVNGFSDIYLDWIRRAKSAYADYATAYPTALLKIKNEQFRNPAFALWLDSCSKDPRTRKLDYTHFLKGPITHIQQMIFLLRNILKLSIVETEERRALERAIIDIDGIIKHLDKMVAAQDGKIALLQLQNKLKYRPTMPKFALNLDHFGRELLYSGPLQRFSSSRFNLLDTQAILLDNFLILARTVNTKNNDGRPETQYFDVSRNPIPVELLMLESRNDEPVVKSALVGVTKVVTAPSDRIALTKSKEIGPGSLAHTASSSSVTSMLTVKSAPAATMGPDMREENILWPFKVKHLGVETYTLFASSSQIRDEWCDNIIKAQTKHAKTLFNQNSEPFKLRVMADTAFGYESSSSGLSNILIKDTPLDRAVRYVENKYPGQKPYPICRAKVNCATSFTKPDGTQMVAIGTDFGLYISTSGDPRGWVKVGTTVAHKYVTQIAALEDLQLFLLLSNASLIACHLESIRPDRQSSSADSADSSHVPQKLSGNRDVGFFATGRLKDRSLVFYKKRDGISSTFKVLEPVLDKSSEKRSRLKSFRSGRTDFFREFDEFYIAADCSAINLFNTSIAVASVKGVEILNLDRKIPMSIPGDIDSKAAEAIKERISGCKPLGMFRISDQEFLLAYDQVGVYVNKQGDISRSQIMEYVGKAQKAAVYGPYVLLFDNDFVEVRNMTNGHLRQIIAGRDVKCLDDGVNGGSSGKRTIKVSMTHPEAEKYQIVVELILNDGFKD